MFEFDVFSIFIVCNVDTNQEAIEIVVRFNCTQPGNRQNLRMRDGSNTNVVQPDAQFRVQYGSIILLLEATKTIQSDLKQENYE